MNVISFIVLHFVFSQVACKIFTTKHYVQSRIHRGKPARPHQFPYLVGINASTNSIWCGGSLISKDFVLTAAHCLAETPIKPFKPGHSVQHKKFLVVDEVFVHLGAHNRYDSSEANQKIIRVLHNNIIIYNKFDVNNFDNDISLIKLPQDIIFNSYISPINLPPSSYTSKDLENSIITTIGWGRTGDKGFRVSTPKYATLRVTDGSDCYQHYQQNSTIQLCMRGIGSSTCRGDSGGPNVYSDPDYQMEFLVGITSFSHKDGCSLGYPTVKTRVSYYLGWISRYVQ